MTQAGRRKSGRRFPQQRRLTASIWLGTLTYLSKSCLPANWGKHPTARRLCAGKLCGSPTSHSFVTAAGEPGTVMAPSLSTGLGCQVVVNLSSTFLDPSTTQDAPSLRTGLGCRGFQQHNTIFSEQLTVEKSNQTNLCPIFMRTDTLSGGPHCWLKSSS